MRTISVLLLMCVLTLALPQVQAQAQDRCTYGASGDLVGHEIYVNRSSLAPATARHYSLPVPTLPGCSLNGVMALVCDTFAPEVDVVAALAAVEVRRLGPRLRPLSMDLYLYCDPLPRPRPRPAL